MRPGAGAALVLFAALAVALGACGGGSSGSSSEGSSAASAAEPGGQGNSGAATDGASAPSGELTPPDTRLRVGETATVSYVPYEEEAKSGEHEGIEVKVTVTAIEEKSQGVT